MGRKYYICSADTMKQIVASKSRSDDIFIIPLEGLSIDDSPIHLLVEYDTNQKRYVGVVISLEENKYHEIYFLEDASSCIYFQKVLTEYTGVTRFRGIDAKVVGLNSANPQTTVKSFESFEIAARQASILAHGDELDVIKIENGDP